MRWNHGINFSLEVYTELGEFYEAQGNKVLAKEYLIRGVKLFISIGYKPAASWAISKLKELDKK